MNPIIELGRTFGVDLMRYDPENTNEARLVKSLNRNNVGLLIDVGANDGTYASNLFKNGFKGNVISFEPVRKAHARMKEKHQLLSEPNWTIMPRCAIGNKEGTVRINIAKNDECSSLLPVRDLLKSLSDNTHYVDSDEVAIHKLDDLIEIEESHNAVLKIDVQGYEDEVLKGATEILKKVKGIQIELSLVSVYEGDKTFDDLFFQLYGMGFRLETIFPVCFDNRTGQTVQVDCLFFREE